MWVLAHRGASKQAPENTLKAFHLAIHQGADGIEFDTYQVADDIVVIHDRWVNRTTSGKGLVTSMAVSDIRSLDAGEGEHVPLICEVLKMLPPNAICNIEIKYLEDCEKWLKTVDLALAQSQISESNLIVSSFNHRWLRQLKTLRPTLPIGALTATYPENSVDFAKELSAWSVHMAMDVIDREFVDEVKHLGRKVLVYTVDNPEDMLLLKSWGVDGIFTNLPDLAVTVLNQ